MVGQEQGEGEVEVIHSWSAPRSLSTSLMYSFAQVSNFPFTVSVHLDLVLDWLIRKLKRIRKRMEWMISDIGVLCFVCT
jgi:hypothetical protein